jgi:hypothetical protein
MTSRDSAGNGGRVRKAREERSRVAEDVAARLRRRGVKLSGNETDEDLVDILNAVERFEVAVARRGGDSTVDQPVGIGKPIAPDSHDFVLPVRHDDEKVASFIGRIDRAAARIAERTPR